MNNLIYKCSRYIILFFYQYSFLFRQLWWYWIVFLSEKGSDYQQKQILQTLFDLLDHPK
jgi:hypothetical protein